MLNRLVAFPESRRVLALHMLSTPFMNVYIGVTAMLPVLLRRDFGASEWETVVVTSALPVISLLSIFWNEVYRRVNTSPYLMITYFLAFVPLAGIALSYRCPTALACIVVSAVGVVGLNPLWADILRSCYPPMVRSKVFSVLNVIAMLTQVILTYIIGVWLDFNNAAYRIYLPIGVGLLGVGALFVHAITRQSLFKERLAHRSATPLWVSLLRAYRNMKDVLRDDPDFRRHETAFSIYGLGWMICYALLPFLVVDVLHLQYGQIARSTQVTLQVTQLLMFVPIGYLVDRIGSIRTSAWVFALMSFYPLGLILIWDVVGLTIVTMLAGMAMSGVLMTWTIGPITLAQNASQAPHYMAIHATLVGARAIIGQFPAVALYKYTGDIRTPLAIAVLMFAIGATLMFRLARDRQKAQLAAAGPPPIPAFGTQAAVPAGITPGADIPRNVMP